MGLLAVKAAEELSKYIVDKYHYGIDCNTCKYKYAYYARLDFISDCEDVCEEVTVTTYDTTLDCSGRSPVFVASSICTPATEILDCNQDYVILEMQAFEDNAYLYSEVVTSGNPARFEFTGAVVNSVSYLSGTRYVDVTPANVETQVIGSVTYIMNIINFLNSLNLPNMVFYPGTTGRTMKVRFPSTTTWQISSVSNSDLVAEPHGAQINQTGLINLETVTGGGYSAPPYAGSTGDSWQAGYNTIFSGSLC